MSAFSESVMAAVFARQRGKCAFCGRSLNQMLRDTAMNAPEYHHVQPQSAGGADDADNCVALCTYSSRDDKTKDGCHYHIHQRGYYAGAVPGPEVFKFAYRNAAERESWVATWTATYGYPDKPVNARS